MTNLDNIISLFIHLIIFIFSGIYLILRRTTAIDTIDGLFLNDLFGLTSIFILSLSSFVNMLKISEKFTIAASISYAILTIFKVESILYFAIFYLVIVAILYFSINYFARENIKMFTILSLTIISIFLVITKWQNWIGWFGAESGTTSILPPYSLIILIISIIAIIYSLFKSNE